MQTLLNLNGLNIIDFLEVHKDFFMVGGYLKAIHDRLKSGVAIVALQKNKGLDTGLGGARGLEKPRLYLSMEPKDHGHQLKIVKAKNWAGTENPNGLCQDFKLAAGCKFIPTSQWYRDAGR